MPTYEEMESRYPKNSYNRRLIDGKIAGRSRCVGYCLFSDHRGYLTKELRKEHNCVKKGCHYYLSGKKQKQPADESPFDSVAVTLCQELEELRQMAFTLTKKEETVCLTRVEETGFRECVLYFIAAFGEETIERICRELSDISGWTVSAVEEKNSFERMCRLILLRKENSEIGKVSGDDFYR